MIIEFLKALTEAGYRLFTVQEAKKVAAKLHLKESNVPYILRSLVKKGMIYQLYRGTYAIEDNILSGSPIHKFEIAMHLSRNGAICCWSALTLHDLSDQILSTVFVFQLRSDAVRRSDYKYNIDHTQYQIIQVDKRQEWGFETIYFGETKVNITDLERTLLDALIYPQYCGGIREVMSAFLNAKAKINVPKFLEYSNKTSLVTQKRLGWILSHLGLENLDTLKKLIKTAHYDRLNPLGPRRGKYNKEWMLVENF